MGKAKDRNGTTGGSVVCTEYAKRLKDDAILSQYPRPQMVRSSCCILNGWWEYAIVPKDASFPVKMQGKIRVPFSPETMLSGVGRNLTPKEKLCYQRVLNIKEIPEKGRLLLHFGAVDEQCEVLLNGKCVGMHNNGYLPFTVELTNAVRTGDNLLQVAVCDCTGKNGNSYGKQSLKPGGMFYPAQSGIWQTVWYEWVPKQYIQAVHLTPDADKRKLQIRLDAAGNGAAGAALAQSAGDLSAMQLVHAVVMEADSQVASYEGTEKEFCIPFDEVKYWEPEHPFLYDVVIRYGEDEIRTYFAFRSLSVEKDEKGIPRLCLNHRFLFQNGVLDQGYWPESLYTPPSDQAMIDDILAMKRAGFNMIRKHCKIEPERWYYHCDRLGMLVWQDIVNGGDYRPLWDSYFPMLLKHFLDKPRDSRYHGGRTTECSRAYWYQQMEGTIRLLKNHPCVITWVLFNEGWGQFDTEKNTARVRMLDDTRFIDQSSGWFDHKGGDIKSVHNYYQKLECPQDDTERAKVISEYGGLALVVENHQNYKKAFGYQTLQTFEEYQKQFREKQEEIQALIERGLSAAVYTQLSDVEDEINGILTYDRKCNKLTAENAVGCTEDAVGCTEDVQEDTDEGVKVDVKGNTKEGGQYEK